MFTGIITQTTSVQTSSLTKKGLTIVFKRPKSWEDLVLGESIATDGVCLTISALKTDEYECFLMPETLAKTTFGYNVPKRVNLERSLSMHDRFGGHFVQGHVDGVGEITAIDKSDGWRIKVSYPAAGRGLVVNKGSIAINGVSLTITDASATSFGVALIPHTLDHTTLGNLSVGDKVNLEFDMIAKHVASLLQHFK